MKRYDPSSTVGSPEIQQYASLRQQVPNVDAVVVVTTAQFTSSAADAASDLNVKLVDGDQLCKLIETHNAYDILQPYLNLDAVTGQQNQHTAESSDQSSAQDANPFNVSANTRSEAGSPTPPDSLSGLISLRKAIADELPPARENITQADAAFAKRSFGTAVDIYTDVLQTLINLQRHLERYEAGFDTIDTTAATHLDSPDEFREEIVELREYTAERVRKAEDNKEKADALATLADEIEDAAETASTKLSGGDRHRSRGNIKRAQTAYQEAADAVAEATATRDTYRGMEAGYEEVLPEDADEPPVDIDLDHLASKIEDRTEWATNTQAEDTPNEDTQNEESYDAAARHEFLTDSLLKRTHESHGGYTDEPPESYLNENEFPRFAFYSDVKGHTIEDQDGSRDEIRSDSGYGSLFLLSDDRVLILAGREDGDAVWEVSRPLSAEYSIGRLKNRLSITPMTSDDNTTIHLWIDTEFDEETLRAATEYLSSTATETESDETASRIGDAKSSSTGLSDTTLDVSPKQLVNRAEGSFSKKILTKTRGRLNEQPLIDYLAPDEHLEYVLWHRNKGFRITESNGVEKTPHHTNSNGARFLMVTNHRLCYVAGEDGYDESMSFTYDEITRVEKAGGVLSSILKFTTTDGTTYQFPEFGEHSDDVKKAVAYIRTKI